LNKRGRHNAEPAKAAVSIQDVADAAQVSIATVSRVLNNPDVVSAATAARVREVVQRLGYVPNPFAQGLITRASRVLCFALPDIFGEFYSGLIRGADAKAHELGYHLLVSSEARGSPTASKSERAAGLALGLVDGLAIMITEPSAMAWRNVADSQVPVVLIDVEVNQPGADCLVVDNAVGTAEATRHLLAGTAPERVYFVGGPKENFDTRARAEAFAAELRKAGREPAEEQLAYGQYSVEWGYHWMEERVKAGGAAAIAVLAGNDEIAVGVMQAAEDGGVRVPHDVRVVGFDDTRIASLLRPKLSSVRVPLQEIGAAAIAALAARLEDRDRPPTVTRLATTLVVRGSSAV
jgi:LacI family transcriptional regulator